MKFKTKNSKNLNILLILIYKAQKKRYKNNIKARIKQATD